MNISGIDFITLLVSDLEESYHFYKNTLGLKESSETQPKAHAFATQPVGLAIRQAPDGRKMASPNQGILIWLRASDSVALHNELKEKGVSIVEEPRESPFGMIFSFKDPDGYIISVHDGG